jgi:MFS family permease
MASVSFRTDEKGSHLLRNPKFRLWWLSFGTSLLGDQFYVVALPWVILQLTGSAVAMGTVMMLGSIPRTVLMLMGGAISDRFAPRRVMLATALTRALLVAAVAWLLWASELRLGYLFVLALAFGVADAFEIPAFQAFLPSLVRPEQLVAANSLGNAAIQFTSTAGPAAAGIFIKAFGAAWAFFLDAFSFVFLIFALCMLPDRPIANAEANKLPIWRAVSVGLTYVYNDRSLLTVGVLSGVVNLSITGAITVGLAELAKVRFGSPAMYGFWVSAYFAGSLIGSLLAGRYKVNRRGLMMLRVCAGVGIGLLCVGVLKYAWAIAGVIFCMGGALAFNNVHMQAWCQRRIDPSMLGRVMSVLMLASFGLMPVSMFMAGVLAQWSLLILYTVCGISLLATLAWAALYSPLREI